jgi:SAM-dependent methyltransferase
MVLKVNLGSGPDGRDDWINVDYGLIAELQKRRFLRKIVFKFHLLPERYRRPWSKNLLIHDCRKPLPFQTASVDYIYTSHLLEHLRKYEATRLLRECFRVMKPNGYIRIVLPDLELIAERYLSRDYEFFLGIQEETPTESTKECIADLFNLFFHPPSNKSETKGLVAQFINRFARWHLWMYDFHSLKKSLADVGFVDIERTSPKAGKLPDIEHLDKHCKSSMFVEARRVEIS